MLLTATQRQRADMARILYAILGEGMGHATRSAALIDELKKRHRIRIIVSSKRAYKFLKQRYRDVHFFEGASIVYKDGEVDDAATLRNFFGKTMAEMPANLRKVYRIAKSYNPDIIITDFEGVSAAIGALLGIPVICICNIHSVSKLRYHVPARYRKDHVKAMIVIKALFPRADYHLITSFFDLPAKDNDTFLFPPILRKEILRLKPKNKDYILVYQTSQTNHDLIDVLRKSGQKFIIYGFNANRKEKNIVFRKFNTGIFLKDLEGCKACISNGGYSFLSEAISLHKPILCIPVKGQFEQILNAIFLRRLGYGEFCEQITEKNLKAFITRIKEYRTSLGKVHTEDNSRIIRKIEEIINAS